MKNLNLYDLELIDNIVSPEHFEQTTLSSPAKNVFTDFKKFKALVIEDDTPAAEALRLMENTHLHMKIVVSENNDFLGIIGATELTERHIVAEVAKGTERHEVLVRDLMVARDKLHAFDYHELEKATVNDVVAALKNNSLRHCLVLDRKQHYIRGVISTTDIMKKLQLPIDIHAKTSFSQIFTVIHGKY